jgi:hypothetical protein
MNKKPSRLYSIKIIRGKTIPEKDVGIYTSHQSAKSPKIYQLELSMSEILKVSRLASAAFQYITLT